jgi:hypothetical protein
VINVPKLLKTTYELRERMNRINEQQQDSLFLPPNGDIRLKKENYDEKQLIQKRIHQLEYELNHLKSQLITISPSK